jgi:hypothetical protein
MSEQIWEAWQGGVDRVYSMYPIMVRKESIDEAVDLLMKDDPLWWQQEHVTPTMVRKAFTAWLDQRVSDMLESPSEYVHKAWSGFDHRLDYEKKKAAESVKWVEAVVVTAAAYHAAEKEFARIMALDNVLFEQEINAAYDVVERTEKAWLAAVETALRAKAKEKGDGDDSK